MLLGRVRLYVSLPARAHNVAFAGLTANDDGERERESGERTYLPSRRYVCVWLVFPRDGYNCTCVVDWCSLSRSGFEPHLISSALSGNEFGVADRSV